MTRGIRYIQISIGNTSLVRLQLERIHFGILVQVILTWISKLFLKLTGLPRQSPYQAFSGWQDVRLEGHTPNLHKPAAR